MAAAAVEDGITDSDVCQIDAGTNCGSAKQQRTAADQHHIAASCLSILVHAEVLAYLKQPQKLRLQETCRDLCNQLHSDAAWRELDLTYATYKADVSAEGLRSRRPISEQLVMGRAVIKQPKYGAVCFVNLNGLVVGSQSTSNSKKSKVKLDNSLVAQLMRTLPNVRSLSVQRCYNLGRSSKPVFSQQLIRSSWSKLKHLSCSASLTLLRPVLSYCKQLVSLHLSCLAARELEVSILLYIYTVHYSVICFSLVFEATCMPSRCTLTSCSTLRMRQP
jgi:hypothetical protein